MKKDYLTYIEYGGDMECHECVYVDYKLVSAENEIDALIELQKSYESDISNGTFYGRPIKFIELPNASEGMWKDLKIIEIEKPKEEIFCGLCNKNIDKLGYVMNDIKGVNNTYDIFACEHCHELLNKAKDNKKYIDKLFEKNNKS